MSKLSSSAKFERSEMLSRRGTIYAVQPIYQMGYIHVSQKIKATRERQEARWLVERFVEAKSASK